MITDFVIADVGSGMELGQDINPGLACPTIQTKGVDNIKLATLSCSISGVDYSDVLQSSFKLVGGDEDDGPWVYELPSEFLQSLASIDKSQLGLIAKRWLLTEELQMDRWSLDDANHCITELSVHANKAIQSGKSMYLWMAM